MCPAVRLTFPAETRKRGSSPAVMNCRTNARSDQAVPMNPDLDGLLKVAQACSVTAGRVLARSVTVQPSSPLVPGVAALDPSPEGGGNLLPPRGGELA